MMIETIEALITSLEEDNKKYLEHCKKHDVFPKDSIINFLLVIAKEIKALKDFLLDNEAKP